MSRLPLNTLPTFRTVAELQNLRAAADSLHLTHSAISQQIRLLETQLGFPLFDRQGKRIRLNAAGETFLSHVVDALMQIETGAQLAAASNGLREQKLRVTVLPSFAQRWLLPRINNWHAQHPDITLTIQASQQTIDLLREGVHVAIRGGEGNWPGLVAERLFDAHMTKVLVGSPTTAKRLKNASVEQIAREPLLGDRELWNHWFAAAGLNVPVTPVAVFNDAGLMLQAAEQGLGLALSREVLAADALRDGRLVRLSPLTVDYEPSYGYYLVYPPTLKDWQPLALLRQWLYDELERSRTDLHAPPIKTKLRRSTR